MHKYYAMLVLCALVNQAHAIPVIYDFVGSGFIAEYPADGGAAIRRNTSFTGSVTINVVREGPQDDTDPTRPGLAVSFLSPDHAYDSWGWVHSDIDIHWDSGSFNPTPLVGREYLIQRIGEVRNGTSDSLMVGEDHGYEDHKVYAYFSRSTSDTSWLDDLSFDLTVGLAPNGTNTILFGNLTRTFDSDGRVHQGGYWGNMDLSSLSIRPVAVPEPGTLALFAIALVGVGFSRQRRRL